MPRSWGGRGWQHRFEASRVAYLNDFRIDGRIIADFRELKIEGWTVPAQEAEAYNDVAKKVQKNLLTIWAGERFGRIRPWVGIKGRLIQVLGFLGFVAVYLLVVFLLWR